MNGRPVPYTFDQFIDAYGRFMPFGAAISLAHNGLLMFEERYIGADDEHRAGKQWNLASRAEKAAIDGLDFMDGKWKP